jgi:hypothetical protein
MIVATNTFPTPAARSPRRHPQRGVVTVSSPRRPVIRPRSVRVESLTRPGGADAAFVALAPFAPGQLHIRPP